MHVDLSSLLWDVLSDLPSRANLRRFVAHTHAISLAYLRTKARRGNLDPSFFGLSLEDLALDCIAPLFERDETGTFVALRDYFEPYQRSAASNAALEAATRRLVFGTVNEALFETYRDFDPVLSRIIRNLKKWVVESEELRLSRRTGTIWVAHVAFDDRDRLPVAAEEFIESHLVPIVAEEQTADRIVAALETLFARADAYRAAYPLTALARILKSCYDRLHEPHETHYPPADDTLTREERQRILVESLVDVRIRMYDAYVETEKLEPQQYARYFRAIHDRLWAEYVHLEGNDYTNFNALHRHIPTLSKNEYRRHHRPIFEYLSKLARRRVVESLKKFYFSNDVPTHHHNGG